MTREEAIKEIKSWDFLEGNEIEAIQTLIPELSESEDEKIRKELIEFIQWSEDRGMTRHDFHQAKKPSEWIAYLEKQKDSGIKWLKSDNVKNPDKPYIDKAGMFYTTDGRMCHASEIEKQKEQDNEEGDFTIYHPLKNGKGEYECIPYSFYGSLTSFSEDKDLIDFLHTCFYTEEECNEWIEQQKEPHYTKRNALFDKCVENCDPEVMKSVSDEVDEMLEKEQKPELPSELDVAAIDFADYARKQLFTKDYAISSIADYDHGCIDGFKAGAKWQKERKPEEKSINWTELTWKDINELEGIINKVHYEFRNGIGEESFGKEVLEKFREYKGDEYLDEIEQKPVDWDEYTKTNLDRALQIIKKAKGTLQGYQSDDGIYECDKAIECLEHFLYRGLEIEKHTECIEFANEFDNQVSHLLASVLNGEHEYNKDFVKYAAQSLLGYAKNELKPDEWSKREKLLMKALQTSNAQIGELVEENYKLKEQKPVDYEAELKKCKDNPLYFYDKYVTVKLKSAKWSEEDENQAIEGIIPILKDVAYQDSFGNPNQETMLGFARRILKSLRPQPKQEWGGEDEEMFFFINELLENKGRDYFTTLVYDAVQNWLKNRFKSLRPQPKVELTLLDENIIEAAVAFVEQNNHFNYWGGIDKRTVIKALRSLKPHWKPSKDQMEALLNTLHPDDPYYPELKSLHEQLQKL